MKFYLKKNRFYCPSAPEEPQPCYIQRTGSWLTNSSWHMFSSHQAVENFYLRNETKCNLSFFQTNCYFDFDPSNFIDGKELNTSQVKSVDAGLFFSVLAQYNLVKAKLALLTNQTSQKDA